MQFVVFVDGQIIGQVYLQDDTALDRLLSNFPSATIKTPAQAQDHGWR